MMRRLTLLSVLAVSSGLAAPVFAGDQPVITTGFPVSEGGDFVIYRLDSLGSEVTGGADDLTVSGVAAATGSGNSVGQTSLSRSESASLYSRLMAEAKERGLK